MSIHQSKGLEFPIVARRGFGEKFQRTGFARRNYFRRKIRPVSARQAAAQPADVIQVCPHWLAQKNQRRELRGEELRLLYVALTRARDMLILSGGISEKKWETVLDKIRRDACAGNFIGKKLCGLAGDLVQSHKVRSSKLQSGDAKANCHIYAGGLSDDEELRGRQIGKWKTENGN